jgi:hypothetical protein
LERCGQELIAVVKHSDNDEVDGSSGSELYQCSAARHFIHPPSGLDLTDKTSALRLIVNDDRDSPG